MHSTRRGAVGVVTNAPVPNGNAVVTDLNDGAANLSPLLGPPFKTYGTGYTTKHVLPHFGPLDLDRPRPERSKRHRSPIGDSSVLNVLRVLPEGTAKQVGSSPVTLPVRDDLLARPQRVAAH
jgi:hypothetical protein